MNSDRLTGYRVGTLFGWIAMPLLLLGLYLGLFWAPPDVAMGDVQRLMYIHFPSWIATALAYFTAFVASTGYLVKRRMTWDHWAVAGAEIGLLFNTIGLITGSIWGRPTWGVWWTWDARLTTTAIMWMTFAGYLVLRAFLEDPERRARISSLAAIIGFLNVPIVYFSVRWWRTLHQVQSSPETVDPEMVVALRVMFVTFALGATYLMSRRARLAALEYESERMALEQEELRG